VNETYQLLKFVITIFFSFCCNLSIHISGVVVRGNAVPANIFGRGRRLPKQELSLLLDI